ncbi:MAG TPA: hypothetical protein DEA08_01520 [Planctomycetes bacterium]|nr:hypothetical protein [Planctomycetota bacterium]
MSTVAVGDIHGRSDLLAPLLEALREELAADDVLVFLGDYVDRGPDVKGCLELLAQWRAAPPCATHFLRGNHEDWLLRSRSDPTTHSWVLGMDGLSTVRSYDAGVAEELRAELASQGQRLLLEKTPISYERFFSLLPASHLELLDALELAVETPDAVCAHAGYDASRSAAEQDPQVALWGPGFPEAYDPGEGGKPLIYGHHADATPAGPRVVGRAHGIDAVAEGALLALRLPEGRWISSP